MVPDKFNMVDMEGIDLIESQGVEVPGLYQKLVESIAQCRYQCLYNWKFDGILIPPTYVEMVATDEEVTINGGVSVDLDDVIHIHSIEPAPIEPEIAPLLVEENGTYNVPTGVDGFNPVTVDVPSYTPVIDPITITENGIYTVPSGKDGFNPVTVDVSSSPSKYLLQAPIHYDLIGGYVGSGVWYVGDTNARTDIYRAYAGKRYIIHLGSIVGNRLRCAFFTSDPALATVNLNGRNIYNGDSPTTYAIGSPTAMFYSDSDGFIAVGKTSQGVDDLLSYLVEFVESN